MTREEKLKKLTAEHPRELSRLTDEEKLDYVVEFASVVWPLVASGGEHGKEGGKGPAR